VEGAAFTDGRDVTKMDEKSEILSLLADGPQDAGGLSARLSIPRNTLFSLLMNMEKEGLIEWKGQEWAVKPSSDSEQSDLTDTSHPSEGASSA
jgi:hypothetical protein